MSSNLNFYTTESKDSKILDWFFNFKMIQKWIGVLKIIFWIPVWDHRSGQISFPEASHGCRHGNSGQLQIGLKTLGKNLWKYWILTPMLSGFEIYLWPVPVMIHFSPITDPPQKFPVASFSEIRAIHGNSFGRAVVPANTLKFYYLI